MKRFLCTSLCLLLAGCGSSDLATQNIQNAALSAPPIVSTNLAGRVVNESGVAVAGVQVVVHQRLNNLKAQGVSGNDGSFTLSLPAGVYDLGLNGEDPQTATCFYGPITVPTDPARDFILHSGVGRPADQVFGKLWLTNGVPASTRRVTLRSAVVNSGNQDVLPQPLTTTTGANGAFEVQLGSSQAMGLDVEAYDSGGLDEWIDIAKLGKPCYVEFYTEQSAVENRLRCNESDGPEPLSANTFAPQVSARVERGFNASIFTKTGLGDTARLDGGLLTVDPGNDPNIYTLADHIISGGKLDDGDLYDLSYSKIRVGKKGWWWYDYSVEILAEGNTHWSFTDQTNDSYGLWVYNKQYWHKVSYNSKQPGIVKIEFRVGAF